MRCPNFGTIVCLLMLGFFQCASNENKFVGKKLKIKLIGNVSRGDWLRIDDITIHHQLPDTTIKVNPREFTSTNIRMNDSKGFEFNISPSNTLVPLGGSGDWRNFTISRGAIVSSWISCLSINQRLTDVKRYILDMPNYYVYEGILIIERVDGKDIEISTSKGVPLMVDTVN